MDPSCGDARTSVTSVFIEGTAQSGLPYSFCLTSTSVLMFLQVQYSSHLGRTHDLKMRTFTAIALKHDP